MTVMGRGHARIGVGLNALVVPRHPHPEARADQEDVKHNDNNITSRKIGDSRKI